MTKGEIRKQRQAEHLARELARVSAGDTRTARERHYDEHAAQAKRARRKPRKARAVPGSLEWAEARGGLIGGYETDDTYCPD